MGHLQASWSQAATYPDGTPFPDTFGFQVSIGTSPGVYTRTIDVGNLLSVWIPGLITDTLYYVAVRAYDGVGNFSAYSTEVAAFAVADDPTPIFAAMADYRVVGR